MQYTDDPPGHRLRQAACWPSWKRKLEEGRSEESAARAAIPGANYSPMLQQMNVALSVAEARVASLKARVDEYAIAHGENARLAAAEAPEVEAQMAQLNRDYQVNQRQLPKAAGTPRDGQAVGRPQFGHRHADLPRDRSADRAARPRPDRTVTRLFSFVFAGALVAGLGGGLAAEPIASDLPQPGHSLRDVTGIPDFGQHQHELDQRAKSQTHASRLYAMGAAVFALFGAYGAVMAALYLIRPLRCKRTNTGEQQREHYRKSGTAASTKRRKRASQTATTLAADIPPSSTSKACCTRQRRSRPL